LWRPTPEREVVVVEDPDVATVEGDDVLDRLEREREALADPHVPGRPGSEIRLGSSILSRSAASRLWTAPPRRGTRTS
jgi:hypothetical protein